MGKSEYKKVSAKDSYTQSRLRSKKYICISTQWFRWAKRYLNRAPRRRVKQQLKRYVSDE